MDDLGNLQEAHMLMQDADSILYPPNDDGRGSPPVPSSKHRISVSDLWSPPVTSTSRADEDGVVLPEKPVGAHVTCTTPRVSLHSLFEAQSQLEPAPAEEVAVDLRTVFPQDEGQVLHWHPNRSLMALVQLAHAVADKRFTRRRLRRKRFSAVSVLRSMFTKTYKPGRLSAASRTAGRDTYRRVMSVVTGASIRTTAKATDAAWAKLSMAHKNAWADLTRILSSPMGSDLSAKLRITALHGPTRTLTDRVEAVRDAPTSTNLTGYGFSMCFNTDFGQKNVDTVRLVQSGLRGADLRTALTKLPEYKDYFDRFYDHFQKVGQELGVPLVACGMEHSENGDHPARIHLHCFAGIDVRGGLYGRAPREITVPRSSLTFEGLRPNVGVTTSSRKRNVVIHTAVVQCYYYVAGPKLGCLFSRGVASLFKVES